MRKAVKFGGSSLADAGQFRKAGEIIRADKGRRYIVPSAPGKRFAEDIKVTDMLYACYALAEAGSDFREKLMLIAKRYAEIVSGLELNISLDKEFEKIEEHFREKFGILKIPDILKIFAFYAIISILYKYIKIYIRLF